MSTTAEPVEADAAQNARAVELLSSFLDKTLRIHVSDGRMFVGQMKCTDRVSPTRMSSDQTTQMSTRTTADAALGQQLCSRQRP